MTDRKRLSKTIIGAYAFYDRELTEFAMQVWDDALSNEDIECVERAFSAHLRDPEAGRFCPKPADILRQIRGSAADEAIMQWALVLASAQSGGGSRDGITDAAREAVQSIGGWSAICRADESQNGFLQRRFCDAYSAYRRREQSAEVLGIEGGNMRLIGVAK